MSNQELRKRAKKLLEQVEEGELSNKVQLAGLISRSREVFNSCLKVAQSWTGSHFGYHWNLYYGEFQPPPLNDTFSVEWGGINGLSEEWRPRSPDDVLAHIKQLAGHDPAALEVDAKALTDQTKELQTEILVELAPLNDLGSLVQEKALLERIEKWDWKEDAREKYSASAVNAMPNGTRDSEAFHQGMRLPTHIYYEASMHGVKARCESIQEFWKTTKRLLKQLEASDQRLVVPAAQGDGAEYRAKYDNLLRGVLLAVAVLLAFASQTGFFFAAKTLGWSGIIQLPMGIKILMFFGFASFWLGFLVKPYRNWCWGAALLSIVVSVIQVIR